MPSDISYLKQQILLAASRSKEGHIPSAFSILDILWVLYHEIMQVDPKDPQSENRDRFILSKGHASLGLYAILAHKGFFPISEFETFGTFDGMLGGHPDRTMIPGVEASTGSLGHGFPLAVGVALGLKIKKNPARVYVIIGDGECNEGTIWETALLAVQHQLDNLTCIVDYNHSNDRALKLGDMIAKFNSFGWSAFSADGHDQQQLKQLLLYRETNKPVVIIAETIKGKGIKEMENNHAWHHRSPDPTELKNMLLELS